jgi:hypothetical protein
MMLFKRLLTVWFFVFTLAGNPAWADVGFCEECPGSAVAAETADQDRPLPWQIDACADHCCHASAHVVALVSGMNANPVARPQAVSFDLADTYPDSRPLAPPYHPPII